ncbi:MAG: thermostable hemolysin [Bermanella sp.]
MTNRAQDAITVSHSENSIVEKAVAGTPYVKPDLKLVPNSGHTKASPLVQILMPSAPLRPQAEAFIKDVFLEHHQAQVSSFLPALFAVFDEAGVANSALGVRNAAKEQLYLENYLDEPIETLIQPFAGKPVKRGQVVEIGNLASQNSLSCKALFVHITQHLQDQGVEWITCTGTSVLRIVFRRLGIKAVAIHEADQSRLGEEQYAWGSYYDNDPQVMLINVQETNQHFINARNAKASKNSQSNTH